MTSSMAFGQSTTERSRVDGRFVTELRHDNITSLNGVQRPQWPKVSTIVPSLNEELNLPFVLQRIPSWVHEVILVDGRSSDATIDVARRLRPDIRVVEEPRKGKGAALRAGFAAATGDIIVMLDADGSADPLEMHAFIGPLLTGADFVKGSRFIQGGGTADMELFRRAGNWGLTVAVRLAFGGRYTDLCYGYNAFWVDVLPAIQPDGDGFEIETQLNVRALKAQLNVVEIASFESPRLHGTSNLRTIRDGFRVLRTILRERFGRDRRRGTALGTGRIIVVPELGS